MQIEATQCEKCHNVIFARCDGDFRSCQCGQISVRGMDGGMSVTREWGGISKPNDVFILDIGDEMTPQALFEDYQNGWNEWGLLRTEKTINPLRSYEISESGVVLDRNPEPEQPKFSFRKTRKKK